MLTWSEVLAAIEPELPLPDRGATAERWRHLQELGRRDLPLAKLVEPHHDAAAILADLDAPAPEPGTVWAVWAAEPPGSGLTGTWDGASWRLSGAKPFSPSWTSSPRSSSLPVTAPTWSASRSGSAPSTPRNSPRRRRTLDCIAAFGRTAFRGDLAKIDVSTMVIHGDSDAIVPFEVSGKRAHDALSASQLVVIEGGPHGFNATHADQFNAALLDFLAG